MKHRNSLAYLGAITAAFTCAAVIGGVTSQDLLLAAGVAGTFLGTLFIPVLYNRYKKKSKMLQKRDALVSWEYADDEIDEIVKEQRRIVFKQSVSVSRLLSICLAVVFTPLCIISLQHNSGLPPMLPIAIPCIALPWLSLLIAPLVVERTIRAYHCTSVIGCNYILVANRYIGINDRHNLKVVNFRLEESQNGEMARLHVRYSFMAMRITSLFHIWVSVPVPRGREKEAAELSV